MKVDKSIETPEGTVRFQGELSPEEVDVLLSVGINYLFQQGAIPFRVMQQKDASKLQQMVEGQQ